MAATAAAGGTVPAAQGTAEECSRHCDAQPRCAAFTHKRGAIKATCVLYGAALHARLPPVRGYGPQGEQRLGVWLGWEHDAVEVKARSRPPARAHRRVSAAGTAQLPVPREYRVSTRVHRRVPQVVGANGMVGKVCMRKLARPVRRARASVRHGRERPTVP